MAMDKGLMNTERCDRVAYVEEFDALCIDPRLDDVTKYPAKQHALSVAKHLGLKSGLVYLEGRPQALIEDSDQPKTFRQRRYFYYLSGADFEDCVVTYDIAKDHLRLFIPAVNPETVIWLGTTPSKEECERKYDVDVVDYISNLTTYVDSLFKSKSNLKLYALHPDQAPAALKDRVDSDLLLPAMDAARVIKSEYEICMIRRANEISGYAHEGVLKALGWADNETQLEAVFAGRCIARKAKKQAYGIIAASGPNAATLHYQANDEPLEGRQLVCLDAGCEWDCYASDVTRTFPISGTYTKEAKEIYDLVAKMQAACIGLIKPGTSFQQLQIIAMSIAVQGLLDLGILYNGTFPEAVVAGRAFFPHGLGHHIGLEVHDVDGSKPSPAMIRSLEQIRARATLSAAHRPGCWPSAAPPTMGRSYRIQDLEANMIITIEPGIYFSRYAIEEVYLKNPRYAKFINKEVLERYYPVGGVRIEDDILVTKDGYENLTTAPKGEKACEIIREARKAHGSRRGEPVEVGLC